MEEEVILEAEERMEAKCREEAEAEEDEAERVGGRLEEAEAFASSDVINPCRCFSNLDKTKRSCCFKCGLVSLGSAKTPIINNQRRSVGIRWTLGSRFLSDR